MTYALNQPFIAMHGSLHAMTHAMVDPCIDPLVFSFFTYCKSACPSLGQYFLVKIRMSLRKYPLKDILVGKIQRPGNNVIYK